MGIHLPIHLQAIRGQVLTLANCRAEAQLHGFTVRDHLCFVTPRPHGLCRGDMGGPLTDADGHLIGIASLNMNCERNDTPDIFTRVNQMMNFIQWALRN